MNVYAVFNWAKVSSTKFQMRLHLVIGYTENTRGCQEIFGDKLNLLIMLNYIYLVLDETS